MYVVPCNFLRDFVGEFLYETLLMDDEVML